MRSIRSVRLVGLPTATLAVSVVPIARTQQPSYPVALMASAASLALSWSPTVSTIERAPEISMRGSVTPTRRYWASMRLAGSSMKSSLISPTDVESPMWTTDVHDVVVGVTVDAGATRRGAGRSAVRPAGDAGGRRRRPDGVSTEATDAESEPSIQAPTTVRTTTTTAGMARARGNDMRAGTLPVAARQVSEGRRCPTQSAPERSPTSVAWESAADGLPSTS